MTIVRLSWLLAASLGIPGAGLLAQTRQTAAPRTDVCARAITRMAPAADLYCIDLVPAPDFPRASGAVELRRVATPFGVALTADGRHLWDLRVTFAGLAEPRALGGYGAYVAWVTTPTLDTLIRLGAVRNGR